MKRIRLAIIGCGGFVQYHCERIVDHCPEFRCVGLCDVNSENAENLRAKYCAKDAPAIFADHRKMLAAVKPDAVIVSSPHTLHYRHVYDSLKAGADVMVDKPMVTNSSHARRLVKLAKSRRRKLLIAVQGTCTDTFAYSRKLIADGTIGPLQLVTGFLSQNWIVLSHGSWRQNPKLSGGGQFYDSMAHVILSMLYFVNSPPREVFAWTDNKDRKVDINGVAVVKFANGAMASLTSGGSSNFFKTHLLVQGRNALLEISPHGGNFLVQSKRLKKPIVAVPKGWKVPTVSPTRNFADCILGKAKPRCPATLGIMMADLMDGLYKSVRTGKAVKMTKRASV